MTASAQVLQPADATEDRIAAAVLALLQDDEARRSAAAIAQKIAAMPFADDVVEALIAPACRWPGALERRRCRAGSRVRDAPVPLPCRRRTYSTA